MGNQIAMFKNKLQEYTQKRRLPMPAYRNANEGFQHAPKFRVTVFVDGQEYTSKSTFRHLREAEQDAAKLAYQCILSNSQQQNDFNPMLEKEPGSSKLILHEFTFKKHGVIPKYMTIQGEGEGSNPVYVSKVIVKDKTFTGDGARNKRDAEQFAARAALQSLLGKGTESKDALNQMMSSKRKNYSAPIKANTFELNQKKIKKAVAEGPGDASQVKRMVTTSTLHSSNPVTKPVIQRRPDAQRVRYGLGKVVQGATLVNRKIQQRAPFS